jgi:hypothetical protein
LLPFDVAVVNVCINDPFPHYLEMVMMLLLMMMVEVVAMMMDRNDCRWCGHCGE